MTVLSCFAVCSVFFFKQKTAYEMRISDWSADGCSSDRAAPVADREAAGEHRLYLRPTETELAVIRHRAKERRMTTATWAMALVRRHIGIAAPVDRELRDRKSVV